MMSAAGKMRSIGCSAQAIFSSGSPVAKDICLFNSPE